MRLSPARYRAVTLAALLALCAIVVSGAAVRLTGSGLGCDDWPNCNDERLIDVSAGHAAIEQVNRLFTGVVAAAVIAAVLGSLRRVPRRADLTRLSWGLVAGVVGQVVLGGITVLVDLHPVAVQGHFILSMVLVANAVVLWHRAGEPDGVPRRPVVSTAIRRHVWVVAVLTSLGILAGTAVTGAGPHAGDEDARRFDLDISSISRLHSLTVLVAIAATAMLALRLGRRPAERARLDSIISAWIFIGVVQAAVGYVQYFNDVPPLLVGIHVAGATALFVATVQLLLATTVAAAPRSAVHGEPADDLAELPHGVVEHVGHGDD
jgi:cytochrome c oxidase assembly protein subunit 15